MFMISVFGKSILCVFSCVNARGCMYPDVQGLNA